MFQLTASRFLVRLLHCLPMFEMEQQCMSLVAWSTLTTWLISSDGHTLRDGPTVGAEAASTREEMSTKVARAG